MLRSIFQVANDLAISWQDARDWVEFGFLPNPIIVGGRLRFRQADLVSWAANGCPQGPELSDETCSPFWDCLLAELKENDKKRNERIQK